MATLTICDGCREQGRVNVLNGTDYSHVPFLGDNRRYLDLCKNECAKQYWKFKLEVEQLDRVERLSARSLREKHLTDFYGRLKNGAAIQTKEESNEQILDGSQRDESHRIIEPGPGGE